MGMSVKLFCKKQSEILKFCCFVLFFFFFKEILSKTTKYVFTKGNTTLPHDCIWQVISTARLQLAKLTASQVDVRWSSEKYKNDSILSVEDQKQLIHLLN